LHNTIRYKPPDIAEYNYQEEKIMNHNNYTIRRERTEEYREVEHLVREAFWNVYRPGALEHYVLNQLRNDAAFVPELDFVMEKDGKIIGQNMFMRAVIKADDGRDIPIMTMGPICIAKEYQRQGYGKLLLDYSLEQAKQLGCGALCFEGNINFYGKSGFTFARTFGIRYHDLPEGADDSFFLCKELIPGYLDGITGEYTPPQGYFVDEAEAEQFDQEFPPKVKLKLPGQLV
jgi:predicted N-acetyltransferase YhbS